jgi:hypothetical protein|nr:hypothetical protein [uncultured Mediterranean phage uvMED]|tara:strand:+ start:305 stop:487 length:183 start_codon:yes stop_codon:yes gene_type:complete
MKVLVLRNTVASGQALEVGSVYDLSESDADLLKKMGKVTDAPVETKSKKSKTSTVKDGSE